MMLIYIAFLKACGKQSGISCGHSCCGMYDYETAVKDVIVLIATYQTMPVHRIQPAHQAQKSFK